MLRTFTGIFANLTLVVFLGMGIAMSYMAIDNLDTTAEYPIEWRSPAVSEQMREHKCWTDAESPLADIPGHVLIAGDNGPVLRGVKTTARALDQKINGIDKGLTVHGFCV